MDTWEFRATRRKAIYEQHLAEMGQAK